MQVSYAEGTAMYRGYAKRDLDKTKRKQEVHTRPQVRSDQLRKPHTTTANTQVPHLLLGKT